MVDVAFHTGLDDKLVYACRLLRKAYRQGARVLVCGDAEQLGRLDPLLWTFEQLEFVPHVRLRPGQRVGAEFERTPIWLAEDEAAQAPDVNVLVNLGPDPVRGPDRFARVIELVGTTDEERRSGHQRWRYHESHGVKPSHVTPAPSPT